MNGDDDKLKVLLEGDCNFLRQKKVALPKHQPHLVRWVREFLIFAAAHGGYTLEQTLDMFLAALGKRTGVEPWQIRQATDAVRIYRYQYRTDSAKSEKEEPRKALAGNENDLLARLQLSPAMSN